MMRKHFEGYNFVGNPTTGVTFRWGMTFNEDPYMTPWPELVDISISNYCENNCNYCYRQSSEHGQIMSFEDYKFVLEQLSNKKYGTVFQVALGGGEPLLHPDFNRIIELTREYGIVPNYTTSGKYFNQENIKATREFCGAVAISWDPYRDVTLEELSKMGELLKTNSIRSNIHFVVSDSTIDAATDILNGKMDKILKDFNAVIFLTYKPVGRAKNTEVIKSAVKLKKFLKMVDNPVTKLKIGFDACFVPVLIKNSQIDVDFVDSCECGFFSLYIDEKLNVTPCSFCNDDQRSYNLKQVDLEGIWQEKFSDYRTFVTENSKQHCRECEKKLECRGKCPFFDEIFLCDIIE